MVTLSRLLEELGLPEDPREVWVDTEDYEAGEHAVVTHILLGGLSPAGTSEMWEDPLPVVLVLIEEGEGQQDADVPDDPDAFQASGTPPEAVPPERAWD